MNSRLRYLVVGDLRIHVVPIDQALKTYNFKTDAAGRAVNIDGKLLSNTMIEGPDLLLNLNGTLPTTVGYTIVAQTKGLHAVSPTAGMHCSASRSKSGGQGLAEAREAKIKPLPCWFPEFRRSCWRILCYRESGVWVGAGRGGTWQQSLMRFVGFGGGECGSCCSSWPLSA
jgi:hypothetical protein